MICVCFCHLVEGGVRWPPRHSTRRFDSNDFHLALSREPVADFSFSHVFVLANFFSGVFIRGSERPKAFGGLRHETNGSFRNRIALRVNWISRTPKLAWFPQNKGNNKNPPTQPKSGRCTPKALERLAPPKAMGAIFSLEIFTLVTNRGDFRIGRFVRCTVAVFP
jgi:hypothetical protein